jgi:hypothetical protein
LTVQQVLFYPKPEIMKTILRITFTMILMGNLLITADAQRRRSYGWQYYPVRGQHFVSVPGPFISVNFGGNPYYYSSGLFYRPWRGYYEVVPPPFGIHINVLPRGYWSLRWGGYPYFYYNGIFYRQAERDYEVVQAPVGAEVPAIPRDARTVVIDGEKFYEYNGNYFREFIKSNGEIWYRVEGKHGVLNTDRNNTTPAPQSTPAQTTPPVAESKPAIGDVIDKLPDNTRTIVINSKKYYVSTDNVYYEEVIEGNQVRYKVAGK